MLRPFDRGVASTRAEERVLPAHHELTPRPTRRPTAGRPGSFEERYRGTRYETPAVGIPVAEPMARGRLLVIVSGAVVVSVAVFIATSA